MRNLDVGQSDQFYLVNRRPEVRFRVTRQSNLKRINQKIKLEDKMIRHQIKEEDHEKMVERLKNTTKIKEFLKK